MYSASFVIFYYDQQMHMMELRMNIMTESCRCVLRVPGRNIFNFRRESSNVNRWRSLLIVILQVLLQHSLQL